MNLARLPPIAVSCGDPAGIGPEITAKAWTALKDELTFFWIGDPRHIERYVPVAEIGAASEAALVMSRGLPVLRHDFPELATAGTPSAPNAPEVIAVIARAVSLCLSGDASAICTAPIAKSVLVDWGGFRYPGHTEYLADLAGVGNVVMMLASSDLKIVPATIHIPLSAVPDALTPDLLEETIRITHKGLTRDFGISSPRLAIAGLNPHAGENGMLGSEDEDLIAPVIAKLVSKGMNIVGPLSADTMFHRAARKSYDAAIAMYHDQALIPIKTLAFDEGVNVTLGLPFVRTSPDHGTAFGIAGKDMASPTSMIEALRLAALMARTRAAT